MGAEHVSILYVDRNMGRCKEISGRGLQNLADTK